MRPIITKLPSAPKKPILTLDNFKGIDLQGDATMIDDSASPDLLNVFVDAQGNIEKRTGYKKVFATALDGKINHISYNASIQRYVICAGTKIYKWTGVVGVQPELVYTGIANAKVASFIMKGFQYFMDGTNYLRWNGTDAVHTVESVAKIPTLFIATPHAGGGTPFEDFNLLSNGFKQEFSSDGTTKTYQLALKSLDATLLTAIVKTAGGDVSKVETTDFTVNRTTGLVTFTTAPTIGVSNVVITAYKTIAGQTDKVKKCNIAILYGGSNDTRVFVTGNPDSKNVDYWSGLYDATFFPENSTGTIGSTEEKIMGYSRQYDSLIIHKEFSTYLRNFEIVNSVAQFTSKPVNDVRGCIAGKSIQIIDNSPVTLTTDGVYTLLASSVRDEKNMSDVSAKVYRTLRRESNLKDALSFDWKHKYGLCVNNKVYLWDYRLNQWFIWDNIPAKCFYTKDDKLYFGDEAGFIHLFKEQEETGAYNDNSLAINAIWTSKVLSFDMDFMKKYVSKLWFTLKSNTDFNSTDLYITTDRKESIKLKTALTRIYSYDYIDYDRWTYLSTTLPVNFPYKIKAKKIVFFQITLKNNRVDENMSFTNIVLEFQATGQNK
jgi:hypothetical protein